jgi:hypothetical protein
VPRGFRRQRHQRKGILGIGLEQPVGIEHSLGVIVFLLFGLDRHLQQGDFEFCVGVIGQNVFDSQDSFVRRLGHLDGKNRLALFWRFGLRLRPQRRIANSEGGPRQRRDISECSFHHCS